MNTLNKNLNLSNPKTNKICHHNKPFKKLFKNIIIGFGRNKKGQSFIEYSALIVVVILALIAMQSYVKRGIQGKLRESADSIGGQYEPGKTYSDFNTSSSSYITTVSSLTINPDDTTNATTVVNTHYDRQQRQGSETVGAF